MNFCFYSKYNGKSTIEQLRRVTFLFPPRHFILSIENKLHPSFIDQLIVDFDKSRVQRYIFPNNRILLYDDIQSDCVIMQTDQPCTLSNLKE